jgi:hypothetical protein
VRPDEFSLGQHAARAMRAMLDRALDHFRKMQSVAVGCLLDLLAATEAISDNKAAQAGLANCREERVLADSDGNVVLIFFEAE